MILRDDASSALHLFPRRITFGERQFLQGYFSNGGPSWTVRGLAGFVFPKEHGSVVTIWSPAK